MKYNPELLLSENIPPPLFYVTPREIKGATWWKKVRKVAYAKHDERCHACGGTKGIYNKTLEGHELYDIDYTAHLVTLKEIVALCNRCHGYIHVGRLLAGDRSPSYIYNILDYGVNILTKYKLRPQATQAIHWLIVCKGFTKYDAIEYVIKQKLYREQFDPHTWDDWKLLLDGNLYSPSPDSTWSNAYA